MINWYKDLAKPLLFSLDAEQAHYISADLLRFGAKTPVLKDILKGIFSVPKEIDLSINLAGLNFLNPIGLAAGFDKNAELIDALPLLGFGFAEIGTVTPRPQIGNPKPRLFRLPKDEAIVNRMGFNNAGMEVIAKRLSKRNKSNFILGGNIGKNKDTPNEKAFEDYVACFQCLNEFVDYFTINLSSPNTPGLRQLLEKESLFGILEPVQNENQKLTKAKPIFLKISPDMEDSQLEDVVHICKTLKISGIVATNTSISRQNLSSSNQEIEDIGSGGLSGKPIKERSAEVLKKLKSLATNDLLLMASGGIMSPNDAEERFQSGANAVQLYSGLVYEGPGLVSKILNQMAQSKIFSKMDVEIYIPKK
jgi:dihydroorotate dehydrogenase